MSQAARDPRDEPQAKRRKKKRKEGKVTRSPSPLVDSEFLNRPSK
jgi:hypothetical protein